jgi:hypothetical protein
MCVVDHLCETIRIQPIVRQDELAQDAVARDQRQRSIEVRDAFGIGAGDVERTIAARVVSYDVLPIRVRLRQHALDALLEVRLAVIDRSYKLVSGCSGSSSFECTGTMMPLARAVDQCRFGRSATSRSSECL